MLSVINYNRNHLFLLTEDKIQPVVMNNKRKLFIDPSGTGTSGICIVRSEFDFLKLESTDWKEHFRWIVSLIEIYSIDTIIYENTNYIFNNSKHMTGLFKLFGAIETLPNFLPVEINSIPVMSVWIYL